MINKKNTFLTVSWLSGLLSAEILISTGEWGVQMPPLTAENSQEATLVTLLPVITNRCQKLPNPVKKLPELVYLQIFQSSYINNGESLSHILLHYY